MKRIIYSIIFLLFVSVNCTAQEANTIKVPVKPEAINERLPLVDDRPIKNVVFIIADGTGLVQLTSGQYKLVGAEGLLHLQTMPVTGIVKTYAANGLITDSAAGATAYSCGVKTDNGKIAQLPDETDCKTILELAEEKGLSTGIVSTSGVTHATPASYAAHVRARGMEEEIAVDYLDADMEVILGGGWEFFVPSNVAGSERDDDRNLIEEFKNQGYEHLDSKVGLESSESGKLLGLFSPGGMPSENRTPTLAEMSSKAIDVLSQNEDGFFLMIEGSQIDWGAHGNDTEYVLREVQDFDAMVKQVLDFAKEDGETLVVLTADHETGGMAINSHYDRMDEVEIAWTTSGHTGVPVPLMAYGPHAIEFTGWQENTEVGIKVAELLGVGPLPQIIGE